MVAAPRRFRELDELALQLPDPGDEELARRVELPLRLEPGGGLLELLERSWTRAGTSTGAASASDERTRRTRADACSTSAGRLVEALA